MNKQGQTNGGKGHANKSEPAQASVNKGRGWGGSGDKSQQVQPTQTVVKRGNTRVRKA